MSLEQKEEEGKASHVRNPGMAFLFSKIENRLLFEIFGILSTYPLLALHGYPFEMCRGSEACSYLRRIDCYLRIPAYLVIYDSG